ncbi:MAG: hypothetical protein JNJ78_06530 [Anaerolineae bacterium]|nr:hypothetical protein [Anaerolineae bacterium]
MVARKWMFCWIIMLGLLTACGTIPGESGSSVVPLLQTVRSPQDVLTSFIDNWKSGNYAQMYAALSPQSQAEYTLPVFQKIYEDSMAQIQPSDITFTLQETRIQGASAAVIYDLTFVSPVFGQIEDPNRTMRFIQIPSGWGVAWTSMDIVNGMAAGSRVEVRSRRPQRANILDRNGRLLVEQGGTIIALYGSQDLMPGGVDACLDLLARVLKRRRFDLQQYFSGFNTETIFYLGEIDAETDAVEGANLDSICGVRRDPRTTRRYVGYGGSVHVTGYIGYITPDELTRLAPKGYRAGDIVGKSGIEQAYEETLAGQAEQILQVISPSNVVLRELGGKEGIDAQSVRLTIDRDLQMAAAQAMADAYNYAAGNWAAPERSPGAGLVAIDVKTGGILAMVSWPFFDPGVFNPDTPALAQNTTLIADLSADTRLPFTNRTTQQQYFPGSTFKIITIAAASEENLMTEPTFYCGLTWEGQQFGDTIPVRSDWRRMELPESPFSQPAGDITMPQALAASCNPFFYEMGARLFLERGPNSLSGYARQMGLGTITGIGVLPEVAGVIPVPNSVEAGINEAIGQGGVQVTILQMARMVAAIANDGTLYTPYLVQQVGGEEGTAPTFQATPRPAGELDLSAETMNVLHEGMCMVVADTSIGTASFVFNSDPVIASYTACGKTGTAQSGRIEPYGWFVAYAPADDPQIAVAAMVEFSREGSETAAPIIRRVLDTYFRAEQAPFPEWWNTNSYVPLEIREGETGG